MKGGHQPVYGTFNVICAPPPKTVLQLYPHLCLIDTGGACSALNVCMDGAPGCLVILSLVYRSTASLGEAGRQRVTD